MLWNMETVYLGCAAVGGTVLVVQTVMVIFGGGDHDTDAAHMDTSDIGAANSGEVHAPDSGFGLFSVRTVAAFLTFFGLGGWAGLNAGWAPGATIAAASAAGLSMLFAVAWLFHAQKRLASQGNVEPAGAVGRTARVYLRIPEQNSGKGKITVALQGRTVELNAFTNGPAIPTDSEVRIVRLVTADTFEVEPL
ncbi:MAG: hypothetical protein SGI72_15970 [Planctomycetota bacterium]|nr:hypothetical protein [Planctomycetota bacterium]